MNLNNSPTKAELKRLLQGCDDKLSHHCIWVDRSGDVKISQIPSSMSPIGFESATPEMAMRLETLDQGGGYVGSDAANDTNWVSTLFEVLVREWPMACQSPEVHYVDYF